MKDDDVYETGNHRTSLLAVFAGGAGSGFCCDVCMHPVDTLRARLQSMSSFVRLYSPKGATPAELAAWNNKWAYTGLMDAAKKVVRNEGIHTFYQGVTVAMACTIPAHALYFTGMSS